MAVIGYARVSSTGQSLDVQTDKLAACERVFTEKRSGAGDLTDFGRSTERLSVAEGIAQSSSVHDTPRMPRPSFTMPSRHLTTTCKH